MITIKHFMKLYEVNAMQIIEIDFSGCKTWDEFHERIRKAFDFPEWYGKNWSAFWDLLWSECDADKVIIKGEYTLPSGFKDQLPIMHKILERNKKQREKTGDKPFSYEIID